MTPYEKERQRIKRELWDNLPVGLFSAGEIDVMACALAEAILECKSDRGS